ncbi:hypothetical protein GCM10010377_58600 [Streptomyces viridiviolaceus]|nr:hypothetical protein GCM10010377_58600 [Streptomyces viridiviolaceus]
MTVVVSSDTDIYISPGLYGDCLPTVATGGTADSFRVGPGSFSPACSFMLAHGPERGQRLGHRDSRHIDTMSIVKLT